MELEAEFGINKHLEYASSDPADETGREYGDLIGLCRPGERPLIRLMTSSRDWFRELLKEGQEDGRENGREPGH
jgi:hypothetical protein